ncbi:MAG: flagellar export chaperone FliS [Syntrophomonadaceae bacterium]|nr:flagellar export chaperone FliS [Syntrophomonadaceae bacterium]
MSIGAQAYNQYKKTTVETVSPGKLLIMLYDGLLKNINMAKNAIDSNDFNLAHNNIIKAEDIVVEFMSTLDMSYEISKNLYSLYDFMMNRLIEANLAKDKAILEEVESLVEDLRDTWQEALKVASNSANPTTTNLSLRG